MKVKSQKLWRILFILVAIIVGVCGYYVVVHVLIHNSDTWKYNVDTTQCQEELDKIVEYINDECANEGEVKLWIDIDTRAEEYYLIDDDTSEIYDDVGLREALKVVYKEGFVHKDSHLESIRIYGEEIYFCGNNLQYALVYSSDGKPKSTSDIFGDDDIKVKSIGDGWYHIRRAIKLY